MGDFIPNATFDDLQYIRIFHELSENIGGVDLLSLKFPKSRLMCNHACCIQQPFEYCCYLLYCEIF